MQYFTYIKISFKISRKTEVLKGKIKKYAEATPHLLSSSNIIRGCTLMLLYPATSIHSLNEWPWHLPQAVMPAPLAYSPPANKNWSWYTLNQEKSSLGWLKQTKRQNPKHCNPHCHYLLPCHTMQLVYRYCFKAICCLHLLHWIWTQLVHPKHLYLSTN